MNSKTILRVYARKTRWAGALILSLAIAHLHSQTSPARFVGTITAINGDTLTVKPDSGDVRQVQVPSTAVLKRVEPGHGAVWVDWCRALIRRRASLL